MTRKLDVVQLEGRTLRSARKVSKRMEADALQIAGTVYSELLGPAARSARVRSVEIFPNNTKAVIRNGRGKVIGVWEDPPGVCRPPRKGEK